MLKEKVGIEKDASPYNQILSKERDDSVAGTQMTTASDIDRHKRPARLLPFSLLYGDRNKNETNAPLKFYDPPANCSELSQLGYTLNGFYLVKSVTGTNNITDTNLETVFCAFKQPPDVPFNPSRLEKRIARVKLDKNRSEGIHFHVQSVNSSKTGNELGGRNVKPLIFEVISLNLGDAFDGDTGYFTCPKSGIYRFFFVGDTIPAKQNSFSTNGQINLYVNRKPIETASIFNLRGNSVLEAIVNVKLGDKIYLKLIRYDYSLKIHRLSFSGSLLSETS